jgi:hypothetical protein
MTNSRFTRETKPFASFRKSAEVIKRERKLKQKIDKDKKSLYVDSRSTRSKSEDILSNLKKLVADSTFENDSAVVSDSFVVSDSSVFAPSTFDSIDVDLIFDDMNREVLLRMMKTLIDTDVTFVESSRFVLDSTIDVLVDISLSAFFSELTTAASVFRVIVNSIIEYVIIDSKDLVDELNRLQQKVIRRRDFERQMRAHDKQRVSENSSIVIELSFSRASVIIALIITASIIIASTINDFSRFNLSENSFRTSSRRRLRALANLESEESSTDIQNVDVDSDDNENDERFDCVKCCRISLNCRRVTNVTCAHCAQQKIVCVSIRS